jgi:hypothetical protein
LSRDVREPDDPARADDVRFDPVLATRLMEIYIENGQEPIRVSPSPDEALTDLLARWSLA